VFETSGMLGRELNRRDLLGTAAQLAVAVPVLRAGFDSARVSAPAPGPSRVGATVSFRQAEFLGLDPKELFDAVLSAGFDPVRIIGSWADVGRRAGEFDLADLSWQMDRAKAAGRRVILAFGAKTPRYPEFNVPDWVLRGLDERDRGEREPWLLEQALKYQRAMLDFAANDPMIEFAQPGNEDLEPSEVTQWRSLSEGYVRAVAEHARAHTRLPLLMTSSMPLTLADFLFRLVRGHLYDANRYIELADAVGFNTHTRIRNQILGVTQDFGPGGHYWPYLRWLRDRTWAAGKQAIIGELQAEPFDYTVGDHGWGEDANISPADIRALDRRARRMGFDTRLVWGVEFAYWRRKNGDASYWDGLVRMVQAG